MAAVREKDLGGRRIAISDDIGDLGVLVSAAHGLDTSWMPDGRCKGWDGRDEDDAPWPLSAPTPWQFDHEQRVTVRIGRVGAEREVEVTGEKMIALALMLCFSCPVQWACAEYGVKARVRAGTYGMRISDMRWLQDQKERALELVAIADDLDVPVQRFVPEMRQLDTV